MKTSRKNPIRKPSSERYAVGRGLKARLIGFLIFSAASFVLLGFYVHRVQQENEKAASQYVLGRKLGKPRRFPIVAATFWIGTARISRPPKSATR